MKLQSEGKKWGVSAESEQKRGVNDSFHSVRTFVGTSKWPRVRGAISECPQRETHNMSSGNLLRTHQGRPTTIIIFGWNPCVVISKAIPERHIRTPCMAAKRNPRCPPSSLWFNRPTSLACYRVHLSSENVVCFVTPGRLGWQVGWGLATGLTRPLLPPGERGPIFQVTFRAKKILMNIFVTILPVWNHIHLQKGKSIWLAKNICKWVGNYGEDSKFGGGNTEAKSCNKEETNNPSRGKALGEPKKQAQKISENKHN